MDLGTVAKGLELAESLEAGAGWFLTGLLQPLGSAVQEAFPQSIAPMSCLFLGTGMGGRFNSHRLKALVLVKRF